MTSNLVGCVVYRFELGVWIPVGTAFVATGQPEWAESAWRFLQLWGKYGVSTCSILMILALWAYVRRLNFALRSDAMDSTPRHEAP